MLILTRKEGESLHITLDPNAPRNLTARDLFAGGPVVVCLKKIRSRKDVRLGIDASPLFNVVRGD